MLFLLQDAPPADRCLLDVAAVLERLKQDLHPLKGSLILLVTMPTEERMVRDDFMTRFRELRLDERCRDICVYCVILETKVLIFQFVIMYLVFITSEWCTRNYKWKYNFGFEKSDV